MEEMGLFLLFIIYSKDFVNSFFSILLSLCEKLAAKLTCAVPLVLKGKIFALLGVVSIVSMMPTENKKNEAKILKSKDLCLKNVRKSTCQFCSLFFTK